MNDEKQIKKEKVFIVTDLLRKLDVISTTEFQEYRNLHIKIS